MNRCRSRGAASHVNVRKGIVLSNGKWLFPVYWQEVRERWDWEQIPTSNEIHNHWPSCCGVLHGEKNGTCFKESGYLTSPYVLMENNCVEAEAGHVIMLMRAQGCTELYRSDSFDYGETCRTRIPAEYQRQLQDNPALQERKNPIDPQCV